MVNVVNEESKKTKRKIVESKKKKTENVVLTKSDIESLMKRLS